MLDRCTRPQPRLSARRKHQCGHLQYLLTARSQRLQKLDRLQTLHRQCQLSSIRSGTLMTRRAAHRHPSRSPFREMLAACLTSSASGCLINIEAIHGFRRRPSGHGQASTRSQRRAVLWTGRCDPWRLSGAASLITRGSLTAVFGFLKTRPLLLRSFSLLQYQPCRSCSILVSQETLLVLSRRDNIPFWRLQDLQVLLQVGHGTPAPAAQEEHTKSLERGALDGKLQSPQQAGQQTSEAQPSSMLATPDRNKLVNNSISFTANRRPQSVAVRAVDGRQVSSLTHPEPNLQQESLVHCTCTSIKQNQTVYASGPFLFAVTLQHRSHAVLCLSRQLPDQPARQGRC